jgi:tetratricopeptide (TPR) repeat protein
MSSFPDGQLYINLRGFGRSGSAVSPAEAVRGFLVALGVAAGQIPAGLDAQTGLYRSMLASRRVLVVLDNARDVEQVRPLLPGSACCLVLVTSRSRLTGLVAAEGARPLPLGLLTAGEARDVLAARLGVGRVTAEARAVGEIIDRCARLPLALAIVAARATAHPGCPLAVLAAELRDAEGGLDGFEAADAATDVRTVLSWSYQALSADAAMLFRLLGLYRGPDITPAAAASLAGLSRQRCCRLLAELAGAHLLTEHAPGRYAGHDLLRAFAAELARSHDSEGTRRAAVHRVLDHYLHTATAAVQFLRQHQEREPIALGPPQPGVSPERVSSPEGALAWLTAERPGLVAAVGQAAAADFDAHAWQLAWTLQTFLLRQGLWPEQVAVHRTALAAARRLGDRTGQAHTLAGLAIGYARWGRLDDAVAHYQQALHLYTELGDLTAQAGSCVGLGELAEMQDRPADALGYAQQVLGLYRTAGDREGQASALNGVGWCHALLGDYPQALAHCRKALTLLQDLGAGDGYGAAATWDSLGYIHRGLADYQQAARCYQHAAGLYRDLSDPYFEAGTLTNLGETHRAAGRQGAARQAWEHALSILGRLGHPDADRVRSMIGSLPHPGPAADPRNPVSPV